MFQVEKDKQCSTNEPLEMCSEYLSLVILPGAAVAL